MAKFEFFYEGSDWAAERAFEEAVDFVECSENGWKNLGFLREHFDDAFFL